MANIPVQSPNAISVDQLTNRVYVTDDLHVSVIDGKTNTVIANIKLRCCPGPGISVNPLTNQVYVGNSRSNTVSVIDGKTNTVIANITTVPADATSLSVDPLTNKVYVTNNIANFQLHRLCTAVSVIDGKTNTVITNLTVATKDLCSQRAF